MITNLNGTKGTVVIKLQGGSDHPGGAIKSDGRRHGAVQAEVGQDCFIFRGQRVDVDADVVRVVERLEHDGDEPVYAQGVPVTLDNEAKVPPGRVRRHCQWEAGEEESHAIPPYLPLDGLDRKGELRDEARHLVGGAVKEWHRVDVRHPPLQIVDTTPVRGVDREVDQVVLLERVAHDLDS